MNWLIMNRGIMNSWRVYIVSRKERSFMFADKSQMFHITYFSSLCEDGKERQCERRDLEVIAMHYYKRLHIR